MKTLALTGMLILGAFCLIPAYAQIQPSPADGPLQRAKDFLEKDQIPEAKALLMEALEDPREHFEAYGILVDHAIGTQDEPALVRLFELHQTYPFARPDQFRRRVNYYELRMLRRIYQGAIEEGERRQWTASDWGFSQLLGDPALHEEAVEWLFRTAMQRRDFHRARFIARLARHDIVNPAVSFDLMTACSLQRLGERQPALGHLIRELGRVGAYAGTGLVRQKAQQAVYLAMVRLHNELDQCFLRGLRNVTEARILFPQLPDEILAYMGRP